MFSGSSVPPLHSKPPEIQFCFWNREHLSLTEVSAYAPAWITQKSISSDSSAPWEALLVTQCHTAKEKVATILGLSFPLVRVLSMIAVG